MKILNIIAPLLFTVTAAEKYTESIQTVFEMVDDPVQSLPAINATVIDRQLSLFCSEIWKWRVDFVIGLMPPQFDAFVDLSAASSGSPYAGMQIVGFSYDSWLRGSKVPINRGRARACDIIKFAGQPKKRGDLGGARNTKDTGGSIKETNKKAKEQERKRQADKKRSLLEYPPLSNEQVWIQPHAHLATNLNIIAGAQVFQTQRHRM